MYSAKELRDLTPDELAKELATSERERFEAKTMVSIGQSKRHHLVQLHGKQVARIKTIQRKK